MDQYIYIYRMEQKGILEQARELSTQKMILLRVPYQEMRNKIFGTISQKHLILSNSRLQVPMSLLLHPSLDVRNMTE